MQSRLGALFLVPRVSQHRVVGGLRRAAIPFKSQRVQAAVGWIRPGAAQLQPVGFQAARSRACGMQSGSSAHAGTSTGWWGKWSKVQLFGSIPQCFWDPSSDSAPCAEVMV